MKFRTFITRNNLSVLAGKNSSQNDSIVKKARKGDLIFHTEARGSPFCILKSKGKVDSQSIEETAIFCASFSKGWKEGKKNIEIHIFRPEDSYKRKGMAIGTFGVRRILKKLKVKPSLAIGSKKGRLQCSPPSSLDKVYVKISQGKLDKEATAKKILNFLQKMKVRIKKERIMQLIPSGNMRIQ